jgi:lysophospholipase L1-like esterase
MNMEKLYTYLALGDSYTVGESIPLQKSFPSQVVQQLRKNKMHFSAPEIIAKTGWTTDELLSAVNDYKFLDHYDFVTLLIGVNNQYRGRRVEEFKMEMEALLKQALELANKKEEHVIVLSIPDYGVTPFGQKLDPSLISKEIDIYNSVARALAAQYKVHYIDITEAGKAAYNDDSLVAPDGLHPSEKEYASWAGKVVEIIIGRTK